MMLSHRRVACRMSPFLLLLWTAAADPVSGAVVPSATPVQEKAYKDPDLYVRVLERSVSDLDPGLAGGLESELSSLGATAKDGFYDWRSGGWGSLVLSVPLVPGDGKGNSLGSPGALSQAEVWEALTRFLQEHSQKLRVDLSELGDAARRHLRGREPDPDPRSARAAAGFRCGTAG